MLTQCVELGLVDGHTQAIDAAFVEANASLDKLEAKPLAKWTLEKNEQPRVDAPDRVSFDKTKQYVNPKKVTRNNRVYYSPNDPQAYLATKPQRRPGQQGFSALLLVQYVCGLCRFGL